ncbi:helix-turn-helix domain-containing protein [Paenibacillus sp. HJL G12]|uniref:Helix-turn-helix domain-containing protein n=1 Tax=Paenibacillus dendrobii TaxID=2691084 RepID=A0A7X3INK5_9BACL|nr:AraC family transcriptional regulator [Paenibacillus dendrobii]MWV47214.1 helix-turn-helix domain-containing protein [Paenibacillus dendrobii]
MKKTLSELTPFVGDSMSYLYDGSSNEHLRAGSVYAFHLFTDGPGEMEIDGKKYPIERRTLIFLRPGQPHAFHIRPSHPLSSYNLYFDLWDNVNPVSPNRSFIHAPEPLAFEQKAAEFPCDELDQLPSVFSLRAHPHLYDGFVMIARAYEEMKFYRSETVNSFLYGWMLSWYNALNVHQPSDYRIVRLLEYLNSHPEHGQTIEAWSRFCGLKRTYFHELFLRETGVTPKAYHHQLVMKRAAHMIVESEASITAIAEKLGYPSIHPFSRHFSEHYGISPSQYRLNPHNRIYIR